MNFYEIIKIAKMNNTKHNHLDFIKKKIREIKIGLFKTETDSEIKLPNNIIQVLQVEDDGTIWFFTSCSHKQAENVEKSFYANLEFHKKGTDLRVQISGFASIEKDKDGELLNMSNYSEGISERLLLVSMKIMKAEYFESTIIFDNISWGEKIKSLFQHVFVNS